MAFSNVCIQDADTDRQTDRQVDRQTDKQTDTHTMHTEVASYTYVISRKCACI